MSTTPETALAQKIDQFVGFSDRHRTVVIDVEALRRLSGLVLRAASNPGYQDFLDMLGDDLVPVRNMVPWLTLERSALDQVRYQELMDLVEPVEQFARVLAEPPVLNSKAFRLAAPEIQRQVALDLQKKRWEAHQITEATIRLLHKRLVLGDTQAGAAKAAGIAESTAMRIRQRTYPSLKGDLDKVWLATFGAFPVKAPRKGNWPITAEKLASKDKTHAALVRLVFDLLKKDERTGTINSKTQVAEILNMSVTKVCRISTIDPSKKGTQCKLAWSETFGAARG